ncbi:iron ABC transporter permease [Nitrospira defluvii]|nr:iron ABC transporter permease [Nitrospira defluvii]
MGRFSSARWGLIVFLIAGMVLIPLGVVLSSLVQPNDEVWRHLAETVLVEVLINTFWLVMGVGFGTTFLGVSLAWLCAATDFPGRKVFDWALMLPMAIPTYVTAFVAIGLLDFSGPLQTVLRQKFGMDLWFPEIRSRGGVILVMTLTLYPYVYLLARNAFLTQGRRALEAAQTLGQNRINGFFKVALPMAKPWIIAGLMLVLMETLADFGAVSVFNYDTFATVIYKAWFGLFSISAASQLASLLVLLVFIFLVLEQGLSRKARYTRAGRGGIHGDRVQLYSSRKWLAFGYASLVFSFAFLIPVIQLIIWSRLAIAQDLDLRYFEFLTHSLFLSTMAAFMTIGVVLVLVYAVRFHDSFVIRMMVKISTLGYALPGSVLAVGIFIPLAWLDNRIVHIVNIDRFLQGTLLAMLLAYLVRFLAVAYQPIQSAIQRIAPNIDESARNLGTSGLALLKRVYLPIMRGGLLTAILLVFVDVMKEMPITLMMRPFGWDTLAIRIFEMTSEGEWERAALPAVALVFSGLIPVILLTREPDQGF